jgi:hypothetical protein
MKTDLHKGESREGRNAVNLPLSTTFDHSLERSLWSLEWVLTSGVPAVISVSGPLSLPYRDGAVDTVCCLRVQLLVASFLLFDSILGCDWLHFCGDS